MSSDPAQYKTKKYDTRYQVCASKTVAYRERLGLPKHLKIGGNKAVYAWIGLKPIPHDEYLIHPCVVKYLTAKGKTVTCREGYVAVGEKPGHVIFDEDLENAIVRLNKLVMSKIVKMIKGG